jgi:hypothetical protein
LNLRPSGYEPDGLLEGTQRLDCAKDRLLPLEVFGGVAGPGLCLSIAMCRSMRRCCFQHLQQPIDVDAVNTIRTVETGVEFSRFLPDFDSTIRRFESSRPSQLVRSCENSAPGGRFPVGELRECLDVAKLGVAQGAQRRAVEIDETQPAAARDEVRRQRIVAEGAATEMRGQAADIKVIAHLESRAHALAALAQLVSKTGGEQLMVALLDTAASIKRGDALSAAGQAVELRAKLGRCSSIADRLAINDNSRWYP